MRITPKWIMLALSIGLVPPAWSAPVAGKLPDAHTITITVSRDKPGKQATGKKSGEVALPGGAQDITIGGQKPKKDHGIGGGGANKGAGKLPDYHTITITVKRDESKKMEFGRIIDFGGGGTKDITIGGGKKKKTKKDAAKKKDMDVNLTGCWQSWSTFPERISIIQNGKSLTATIPLIDFGSGQDHSLVLVFTGEVRGSTVVLRYRPQSVDELRSLAPILAISLTPQEFLRFPRSQLESLLTLGYVEDSFEMNITEGPGDILEAVAARERFHLEGKHFSFHSSISAGGRQPVYPPMRLEGEPEVPLTEVAKSQVEDEREKICQPPSVLLWKIENGGRSLLIDCFSPRSGINSEGGRYGAPEEHWSRVEAIGISRISVTDESFSKEVQEVHEDDRIWVRARAASACPGIRDHFEVNISPTDNPNIVTRVMLEETGPDTLEFRSPAEGVLVDSVLEKKKKEKEKNKAEEPLKPGNRAGMKQSGKARKKTAKEEKKASGHGQPQDIIEVGAPGGRKKAGLRVAPQNSKAQLTAEKEWLERELRNRTDTLKRLGGAKVLYIRYYARDGKQVERVEMTRSPELTAPLVLQKEEKVLFMRKAREHLQSEIGTIGSELERLDKEISAREEGFGQ